MKLGAGNFPTHYIWVLDVLSDHVFRSKVAKLVIITSYE